MSTCTIIIKVKDYFPKIDTIPYQNYICLFTSGENEGQVPLISQENDSYQHQVKNVVSDIKYKVHVLDYNDMSLIGMCDMTISYSIISQITPPNGFIQEQQKKLLMDLKTKRKLFGTVLNMGDIYLNIYSEIYLSEKNNNSSIQSSQKSTSTRKKTLISINNSDKRRKLDGSPRTIQKKKLIMEMNSDRQVLLNLNKNNRLNVSNFERQKYSSNNKEEKNKIPIKPNSSFNYREMPKENNNGFVKINNNKNKNFVKNKTKQNVIPRKTLDKKLNNNNEKEINNSHNNLLNRFKTESNKNNNNIKKKSKKQIPKLNKDDNKEKILKGGVNYFNNPPNKNLLMSNISPKISSENYNENEDLQFINNTGNKITTIESLENIDFSGKKYITKSKTKKNNSNNNINSNINNTLFSTNSTEQEINDIDKIILEKGTEIRNDFNIQLINIQNENTTNDNITDYINKTQLDIKNNFVKLIDFYSLLNNKILKLNKKNFNLNTKNIIYKEQLFSELKKNNVLTQKKTLAEIENFLNVNNHGTLNEKFLRAMIKLKKAEFKIYQNIFNSFYYEYDILKFKEYEKNKKLDEGVKIELLLVVFKNLIKNYGNISQIYMGNATKINTLKNCFNKYGLKESEEGVSNNNIDMAQNNTKNNLEKNNIMENKDNKNDIDKFKVIKEVDEEKEDEIDEEEDKYNNQMSYSNSNAKDNYYNSTEKVKSNNKSNKGNVGSTKLLFNEDAVHTNNNKILDNIKENKCNDINNNKNNVVDDINNLIQENNKYEIEYNEENNNKENEFDENANNDNENNADNQIKNSSNEQKENHIAKNDEVENIDDKKDNKLNEIMNDSLNNDDNDKKEEIENIEQINNKKENIETHKPSKKEEPINEIENKDNNDLDNIKINNEKRKKDEINEKITNNIDSEKDEIKSIRNEKNINNNNNNEVYIKKSRIKEERRNDSNNNINKGDINNNEIKKDNKEDNYRNREVYRRKNRLRRKEEKEMFDEEDLKMQKLLVEEFPKKCKEENRFIRITKYEYSFGEEKIKVAYEDDDVVLKLDEGDYKLEEFIEILNEGKEEEEAGSGAQEGAGGEEEAIEEDNKKEIIKEEKIIEKEVEEEEIAKELSNKKEISDKKSSNKKNKNTESSEKKGKRKRRKKKISVENSQEDEENEEKSDNENDNENGKEQQQEQEPENDKIKTNLFLDKKEVKYKNKDEIKEEKKEINEEKPQKIDENNNNENKNEEINYSNRKYVMKRRKDYLLKK